MSQTVATTTGNAAAQAPRAVAVNLPLVEPWEAIQPQNDPRPGAVARDGLAGAVQTGVVTLAGGAREWNDRTTAAGLDRGKWMFTDSIRPATSKTVSGNGGRKLCARNRQMTQSWFSPWDESGEEDS
jgi:hypothetical protein